MNQSASGSGRPGSGVLSVRADPPVVDRLAGQAAVITGAASGIGLAVAQRLAVEGAQLVLVDLDGDRVTEAAGSIGNGTLAVVGDVSQESTAREAVAAALANFGRLDILHNNAAATGASVMGADRDLRDMDPDVWDRTMAVNVRSAMLFCKHAVTPMIELGRGSIVNTSSGAAFAGDRCRAAYSASKAALNSLTRSVATMYGHSGVRCNAVSPGLIASPQYAPESAVSTTDRLEAQLVPRFGRVQDIAAAVAFLCSGDAAFVTGQILQVDGGIFAHMPVLEEPEESS